MKGVKDLVILLMLLVGLFGTNADNETENDLAKKAEVEITAIPPVVTINLEDTTTERTLTGFHFSYQPFLRMKIDF